MGFRTFLKGKIDKHGGVGGAAVAALRKPVTVWSGGVGRRSSDPGPEAGRRAVEAPPPSADGFVAVAPAESVAQGKPGTWEAHGRTVAVFRVGDELHAIDNACLHEDGPVGEGKQEGHVITCPYHDWRYDVRDGTCLTTPGRRLACYPVIERDGWLWVGPPKGTSSEDRGGEHADGLKTV